MNSRFDHVHFAGEWEPALHDNSKSLWEMCDDYARCARSAGATALQVNFLAEPYGPIHLLNPAEIYHYFTNYGANLDCFVESVYSRGIWPRFLLETNLNRLRLLAEAADRHGLTALLYLCEPRLQREEMFDRYPHWRGPRVDNPAISTTPHYALNTACDEVREHYGQLLQAVLRAAPNIAEIVLFSQDSGSGFSHVDHLYAGSNGGYIGKAVRPVERVLQFCRSLVDAGRKQRGDFHVTLTTSFSDREYGEMFRMAGGGVSVAVRGAMSWTGGLEDQWAWNDCGGGANLEATGFEKSRERRIGEFRDRCALAGQTDPAVAALSPAPNEHYIHLKYVPNPWEQLEILQRYEGWGVKKIFGRGFVADLEELNGHVNQLAFAKFVATPGLSPEDAVRQVVEERVPGHVDGVLEALRQAATAVRQRANFCLFFERQPPLFPGALVPDPCALSWEEIQDHWHPVLDTMRRIRGMDWWMPNLAPADFAAADRLAREVVVPGLARAAEGFSQCLGDTTLSPMERGFIEQQLQAVRLMGCLQRSHWNAGRMAMHWRGRPVENLAAPEAIVADEIANTHDWIGWLGGDAQKWIRLSPYKGALYMCPANIVELLGNRVSIMERHAGDAVGVFEPAPVRARPAYVEDWDHPNREGHVVRAK